VLTFTKIIEAAQMADRADMASRRNFSTAEQAPLGAADAPEVKRKVHRGHSSRRSPGLGWRSPHAFVGSLCFVAILLGWLSRGNLNLSPSDGLGYGLGIAGLAMMVLLLGYSLRKHLRVLRKSGPMRNWFEAHLVLGLLGPTVILYHANFGSGSANATISLACVLAVSGSGVGGRFLYGRMHRSMAGERRTVGEFRRQAKQALAPIESAIESVPAVADLLGDFEKIALTRSSIFRQFFRALGLRPRALLTKARIVHLIREADTTDCEVSATRPAVAMTLSHLCRAGELHLFEQLFALWHAIHVPLTMILFVSAAIHVIAVHLF
jgi:hypothetical protein